MSTSYDITFTKEMYPLVDDIWIRVDLVQVKKHMLHSPAHMLGWRCPTTSRGCGTHGHLGPRSDLAIYLQALDFVEEEQTSSADASGRRLGTSAGDDDGA